MLLSQPELSKIQGIPRNVRPYLHDYGCQPRCAYPRRRLLFHSKKSEALIMARMNVERIQTLMLPYIRHIQPTPSSLSSIHNYTRYSHLQPPSPSQTDPPPTNRPNQTQTKVSQHLPSQQHHHPPSTKPSAHAATLQATRNHPTPPPTRAQQKPPPGVFRTRPAPKSKGNDIPPETTKTHPKHAPPTRLDRRPSGKRKHDEKTANNNHHHGDDSNTLTGS